MNLVDPVWYIIDETEFSLKILFDNGSDVYRILGKVVNIAISFKIILKHFFKAANKGDVCNFCIT